MKRSLAIFFQIFLICSLFTNAWGLTNYEQCVKAFVAKDFTNAYPICKEEGSASAQYLLAQMYYHGLGVKEDDAEAATWFLKAAKQGNADAQYILGTMYINGEGVQKDGGEAAIWFRKAAKQGQADAKSILDKMFDSDKGKWTSYDDFMLFLLKATAEGDDSDSQFELAERYIRGEGVEKNRDLAKKWLVHSILNDPENKKSIELIEKEFNWHCVDGDFCTSIINNDSIIHDKNLSWYWEISIRKFEMDKKVRRLILKQYNVMNCYNRTSGCKTLQSLDYDLRVVPQKDFTIADDKIEFKPLEPSAYSDKLFNYVCRQTNVDKKAEGVHEVSFGTGWPTQHGYIMTNQHVINGKKKIMVVSTSGEKFSATVLIEDKINDLAVLQVDHPGKLPPALPIANASARTGSKVFTIGYPHPDVMGEKPKLTEGIVNALSGYMDDPRILQISVPVQAGNSGGPLLNMNGEVVGIVTAKLSAVKMFNWTGDLPQNVNYAIKASYITALLKSVKEQSTVTKMLPVKRADLESLSSRIQNSVFLIVAE
jgi:hypothetical protein